MSPPPPSDEAVAAQLDRMLQSGEFERSARLQKFLRYVVAESRAGRSEALKEYAIGVEVFGRGPTFDPRLDPIVRVEARRLRGKLKAYYAAAGLADTVRIDMPTGGYEVMLRTVPPAPAGGHPAVAAPASAPAEPPIAPSPSPPVEPAPLTMPRTGDPESAWWRPPPTAATDEARTPAPQPKWRTGRSLAWAVLGVIALIAALAIPVCRARF